MKKFQIKIEEILQNVYEIDAESLEDAISIAEDRYNRQEYELTPECLKETNFEEYKTEIIKQKNKRNRER